MDEPLETCREWIEELRRCGAPAAVILWGKLFPPEALGPRCVKHAEKHLYRNSLEDCMRDHWAIFDLRGLSRGE